MTRRELEIEAASYGYPVSEVDTDTDLVLICKMGRDGKRWKQAA